MGLKEGNYVKSETRREPDWRLNWIERGMGLGMLSMTWFDGAGLIPIVVAPDRCSLLTKLPTATSRRYRQKSQAGTASCCCMVCPRG